MAKAGIALGWIALLLGLSVSSALAQGQTTGRIAGTVKDQRGGLIVRAAVEVTSETTAEVRKVTTDDQGHYNVPLLAPGAYRITVTLPGFALAVFEPVQVVITETTTVDVELAPAGPDTLPVRVDPL